MSVRTLHGPQVTCPACQGKRHDVVGFQCPTCKGFGDVDADEVVPRAAIRDAAGIIAALLADAPNARWEARGWLRRYVDGASRAEVEALDTITGS